MSDAAAAYCKGGSDGGHIGERGDPHKIGPLKVEEGRAESPKEQTLGGREGLWFVYR